MLRLKRKKVRKTSEGRIITTAWSHWPTKSKPILQPSTDNSQVEGRARSRHESSSVINARQNCAYLKRRKCEIEGGWDKLKIERAASVKESV
jgi:hypothetical protein